ncbi:MAG: 50S ribosomal protein L17 [Candidatus Omnitrophica bacterium]|nr:50S ribosomal protein L17 [Candidatus Omnitrophota bacterium]MDE2008495.1 50S ribosomal protein L17 [Candidatus Omnitrophota bacterium]MDE2213961.1 50S ribosomal protein L17 [Candidatus Omnitrophota bacterium]MDE2231384.1 50S ribosomal protein L17 [Candidatus Omnitrophota bacterium]
MRHAKEGNRLSRNKSLRKATLRDMARAVLVQERICTTRAKAKEARKLIEKLITLGKKDTLAARRRAFAVLCDHALVSRLFKETAPRFMSRQGGYTRIIPYMQRGGDNAALAFLELTEKAKEIITGLKRVKAVKETKDAGDAKTVSEAETKPAAPAASAAAGGHKGDVKATSKAKAKPTGVRKLFQRKTGGE